MFVILSWAHPVDLCLLSLDLSDDDAEEEERLSAKFVGEAHFGGFMTRYGGRDQWSGSVLYKSDLHPYGETQIWIWVHDILHIVNVQKDAMAIF